MFSAIFQDHLGYLAAWVLAALVLGGAAWLLARRLGSAHGVWWSGLVFTLTGVFGVVFMGAGPADDECVINHDFAEPFHTTQGLWNLAMTVPVGLFALLATRRLLPVLVGVVVLPLAIEFVQATVDGLGRTCDSADAEMNILGGLIGLTVGATVLAVRGSLDWQAGTKASLIASAAFLVLGAGMARPMVAYTHVDGSGLSAAASSQRQAAEQAVRQAFDDRYRLANVNNQPCAGAPCANVIFTLLSREKGHPEAFGSLSWPDKKHLNVQLENSDRLSVRGYPVKGAKPPSTKQEAYGVAQSYMREHYPWANHAVQHRTYPVGKKAEPGWTTSWRWFDNDVLMPRMLDVQVDRSGRVSRVDVNLGPIHLKLEEPKLDGKQAVNAVREALAAQSRAHGGSVPENLQVKAFTLKAVDRNGTWRLEWVVNVSVSASTAKDTWRVDAVNGQVYHGINVVVKAD